MTLGSKEKKEIIAAIQKAEKVTRGEIRVHFQRRCETDVFNHAKKTFYKLKMQRTKDRNGVLLFVALESRQFAIIGDRGIHEHVGDSFWDKTRDIMVSYFRKGQIKEAVIAGVHSVGQELQQYFPLTAHDKNELPDEITGG